LLLIRNLAKNAAWLGAAQLLNMGIPLLTLPVVTRALGPSLYGLLATIGAYAGYVGLVMSFGFGYTAPRSIAKLRDDPRALSSEVSKIVFAQLTLGVVGAAVFLFILPLLPYSSDHRLISIALLTQVFAGAMNPGWFFIGLERMRDSVLVQILCRGLAAIVVILAVRSPSDLDLYVGANCAGAILSAALSFAVLTGYGVRLRVPQLRHVLSTIRESAQLFFSTLAINLYTSTNVIVVTLVLGPAGAGAFALAERVTQAASGLIGPVITAVYPFVCRIAGRSETEEELSTRRLFFQAIMLLSALCSTSLFCLAPYIVSFLAGGAFDQAILVVRLMALVPVLVALSNILGIQTMLPLNMDRHVTSILTAAAIIGLTGLYGFTKLYGLVGAGLSILLVQSFVTFTMIIILRRRMRVLSLFFRPL
jgi:PST family polysaccharide transporter